MQLHLFFLRGLCFGVTADFFDFESDETGEQTIINDIRIFVGIFMIQIIY
jgi:hypothetical protein